MCRKPLTLFLAACLSTTTLAQNLSDATIQQVLNNLATGATHSWELGTRTEALLELQSTFSVFSSQPIPPPPSLSSPQSTSLSQIFNISLTVVNARPNDTSPAQPLFSKDTAAGDPCSMGVAVLLSNWTGQTGADFAGAAEQQLRYILEDVPQTSDGAISHRVSTLQLWSDSVYMVPPFLAYYGALTSNQSLLEQSYNQIKLYRKYLKDSNSSAGGLWQHIVLGPSGNDPGHWSTGNAWAAAGILRVYATILHSQFSNPLKSHRQDLGTWVNEIHDGIYAHLDPSSGLFFNYADNTSTFLDASSTALLASTVYRNALLTGQHRHIPSAEISRKALFGTNSDGSMAHFDGEGWLTPVVNPENTGVQGSKSPEGQAFVVELEAAWSDWVNAGSPGVNGGRRTGGMPLGFGFGFGFGWGGIVVGVGSFYRYDLIAQIFGREEENSKDRPKYELFGTFFGLMPIDAELREL
ncbi:Six-hairpin glycosidase [Sistotremastrum suecicum HHB10207 ss-3]|uniref:Six-hairpin glycosidase n=1 Tax=Sistotremastrum suecicum HHB10207 ss-3 TaxID=1314776 RepID=A0A165ZVA0_9AGAM|nr:Six-hairpin glycosidase [Sistotremastrum suecicum HHB10207 ss-3]